MQKRISRMPGTTMLQENSTTGQITVTVPSSVKTMLGLKGGDRLFWSVKEGGVFVSKLEVEEKSFVEKVNQGVEEK